LERIIAEKLDAADVPVVDVTPPPPRPNNKAKPVAVEMSTFSDLADEVFGD